MRKYKDFKEYMEDNYLDEMLKRLESYIVGHKSDFEDDDFYEIRWVYVIGGSVCGVTFKDLGDNWLEIRTSVDVDVEFSGKYSGGFDSDSTTKTYNVFFKALLD